MKQYKRNQRQPQRTRTHWSMILLALGLLTILFACQTESPITETRLKIAGSTTVEPVALEAAKLYMAAHPGVEITVRGGGTSIGVQGAGNAAIDIGGASRDLKASELEEWPDLVSTIIGRDGVAVVINRSLYEAGVTQLTVGEVAGIWRGEIVNWQEVGGPDAAIQAYDKELGRGTRDTFALVILGGADEPAPGTIGSLGENETVLATISENEWAVSMLSTGWLTEDVVGVAIVDENGQAIEPTNENVANGSYPITRNLSLITQGAPEGLAADFIAFVLSPEGQALMNQHSYTPIAQ